MRRAITLWLWLLFVQVLLGVAAAQPVTPAFWRASGNGSAYLLGSVHFGTADLYPLPAVILEAFERSEALVVELDPRNAAGAAGALLALGVYTDGTTLRDHVEPSTWRALQEVTRRHGLPVEFFLAQKPWMAALTLTALEFQKAGYSEQLGVDMHFVGQAGDRRIVELETVEQQLGLFNQLSEEEQELFLVQTLKEIDKGIDYLDDMIEAWRAGDTGRIESIIEAGFEHTPGAWRIYRLLFLDRNQRMSARIADLLDQGGTWFVVLGAGHLVGDQGIVELLDKAGYRVERLRVPAAR